MTIEQLTQQIERAQLASMAGERKRLEAGKVRVRAMRDNRRARQAQRGRVSTGQKIAQISLALGLLAVPVGLLGAVMSIQESTQILWGMGGLTTGLALAMFSAILNSES